MIARALPPPATRVPALALAVALALCPRPAPAAEPPAAGNDPLVVSVGREGALLQVRATLQVDAPAATCFEVLADYDHIDEFIPGMVSSEVVSPPGQPIRLRQVGKAGAGPFHVTLDVTLAVTEHPPARIEFDRVAGNLERMHGGWAVTGDAARCAIAYRADIEPQFWVPPLVGPALMRNQVEDQMHGLRQEILRRAGHRRPESTPAPAPPRDG